MEQNYISKWFRLMMAALPMALSVTTASAQKQMTLSHWSFNYGYSVTANIGTPSSNAQTSNGGDNLSDVKLLPNEQLGDAAQYLTAHRSTGDGQVPSQDSKGAYLEVNAINCDGAALHLTSPVPTPETASNTYSWGDETATFPDGNSYSYQNPYNYFELELNTKGYKNLQLKLKAAGHNSQSQYYAVAYSTDHATWTVTGDEYLTGASYNRWTETTVPLSIDDADKAYVRIFPAKNWKGSGKNINRDNQFDLDDVYLYGEMTSALAEITGISVEGTATTASSREGYDYEYTLPNSFENVTTNLSVASANGTVTVKAVNAANNEEVAVTDLGNGSYSVPTPAKDDHYDVTFTIAPAEGAKVLKDSYKLYLFHAGEPKVESLTIDGEELSAVRLRQMNNAAFNYTTTLKGNIYTQMPVVSAKMTDQSVPAITSTVSGDTAIYKITANNRTFTLNLTGTHIYNIGSNDEKVTLNYTTSGKTDTGWTDGSYTLTSARLDGWNGTQFKFNSADNTLSVPAGVVVKQFALTRFSANYGNGEGVTAFTSEGATCWIPTDHDYVRSRQDTVVIVIDNHQPGAPLNFTITGGNQPYASIDLIIEKTNPGTAPVLRSSTAAVNNNHALVTFTFDREMAATEANINNTTVKAAGGTTNLSFGVYDLDYNKSYNLVIPAGAAKDLFGNATTEDITYTLNIGDKPVATKAAFDYVVSNTDEFKAAFRAVNASNNKANAERKTILVLNGDYNFGENEQRLQCYNVSLVGQSRDGVVIRGTRNGISNPVLNIRDREGFYIQDLTLQNDFNFRQADKNTGQAVAVYGGNKTIMKNVRMHGNQDTQVTGERSYFDGCEIHGTVDFICGGGNNFYDHCDLVLEDRGGNVIAAPNTSPDLKWGYVFSHCTIKPMDGAKSVIDGSYNLGRPWQNSPRINYVYTKMIVKPTDNGWTGMGNLPTYFYEYGSIDKDSNLIDLSVRGNSPTSTNHYSPILTQEQADNMTVINVLSGADGWLPTDYTTLTAAPVVNVSGKTLSWQADDQVRATVIFKEDGTYIGNTADNSFTVADDGTYVVRTANDMGGLSADSTVVTVGGATAVNAVHTDLASADGPAFNLAGQRVGDSYKGIVIIDGKKFIRK